MRFYVPEVAARAVAESKILPFVHVDEADELVIGEKFFINDQPFVVIRAMEESEAWPIYSEAAERLSGARRWRGLWPNRWFEISTD